MNHTVNNRHWKILLVEDDEDDYVLTRTLLSEVRGNRYDLHWATSYDAAVHKISENSWDVILVDYDLGSHTGLEVVKNVSASGCHAPVILLTGRGSYETDVEAMKAGAADYLTKAEANSLLLERTIRYAIEKRQNDEELRKSRDELRKSRDELEVRVRERTQELEKANRELIKAEKHMAMSRMIASIAHELNNPIQTIENCLYLLSNDIAGNDSGQEVLDMALSEARRIATLVNQLREIYRPMKVSPMQPLDICEVLSEVKTLIAPHLQHQSVIWKQRLETESYKVNGILDQLKQIFINISLNGIEAMQPHGGELTVEICRDALNQKIGISFK
ncbi:MAG: hybrid sensor histidine kinase/response regulator, partial [Chloroflexi bacterium]